jgi:hypothetical protein
MTMTQIHQDKHGKLYAKSLQDARIDGTAWESNVPNVSKKARIKNHMRKKQTFYIGIFLGIFLALVSIY